jgi:predicted restriction endonuclease
MKIISNNYNLVLKNLIFKSLNDNLMLKFEKMSGDPNEAYDINNGLLLCANADALFDKHLITIDENKNIIFSFLLEHNAKLRSELKLNNEIFTTILNDDRMKYIKIHREVFKQKELLRKLGQIEEDFESTEEDYN